MTRFRVTIDRLVLPGIEGGDPPAIVRSLRLELAKQLSDPAARTAWGDSRHTPVIKLGRVNLAPGLEGSRSFGRALARGIGRGGKP